MPRDFLPGVEPASPAPSVVCNARKPVSRARRLAAVRDIVNLGLIAGLDWLFLRWPATHFPTLDRYDSMVLLVSVNALMVVYIWLSRVLPRWTAKRIASTWSSAERSRFLAEQRRQHASQ
ncbi:MAG TPA: hypothetical protein VF618_03305 [Thermoanaerobaculia bacterium]